MGISELLALTKEGICEPVPLAAGLSNEPSPVHTRSETERCAENTHENVAQTDVQQDDIDRRPKAAKLCKDKKSEAIVEDSRHQDESEAYCHHRVAGPAQPAQAGAARGTVCGAEVTAACVDDHSRERRAEGWRETCTAPPQHGRYVTLINVCPAHFL